MNDSGEGDPRFTDVILEREAAYTCDSLIKYRLFTADGGYSIDITLDGEAQRFELVCDSENDARRIFELISLGGVPPHCAADVIEDLIESLPQSDNYDSILT